MAVDLIVSQNKASPGTASAWTFFFADDGYYWFLYPLFQELANQTGQLIDLYNDARFTTEQLPTLQATLHEARRITQQQPDEWLVKVGTRLKPDYKALYQSVSKQRLLAALDQLDRLIDHALAQNEDVICIGD
jgi:hypothetical protein